MPFSGVQGLVNGWIKVNSKHVVFPKEGEERQADLSGQDSSQSADSTQTAQRRGNQSDQSTTTSGTTDDPETSAIRRFTNKKGKQKRKLQRALSYTDLLREQAKEKEMAGKPPTNGFLPDEEESISIRNGHDSTRYDVSNSSSTKSETVSQRVGDDEESEFSLRFVSGFLGTDSISTPPTHSPQTHQGNGRSQPTTRGPVNTGKYPNEAAFVQQLEQTTGAQGRSLQHKNSHHSRTSSDASRKQSASGSSSQDESTDTNLLKVAASLGSSIRGGTPAINQKAEQKQQQNPMQQFFKSMGGGKRCPSCEDLEGRLLSAHADIEYHRSVALRNEYVCSQCENKTYSSSISSESDGEKIQDNAAQRLADLTARHKRQIEQMTREQSQWQHEMHTKLSKSAMMTKFLSEESTTRKQETLELKDELRAVRTERDSLAMEVLQLRADVEHNERREKEHQQLQATLMAYENEGLERAREAVEERDVLIQHLTSKLEQATETLGLEREKQRQRRHIIFPSRSQDGDTEDAKVIQDETQLLDELKRAKEATRKYEAILEKTKADAAKNEIAWMVRCEKLEKELQNLKGTT